MNLDWIKCQGDVWCKLNTVNMDHSHFDSMHGVYIIWHGGEGAATVRVGQGYIKERLAEHRNDPKIQTYLHLGLYVTWASVSSDSRDGVEANLAQRLHPKVGERYPNVIPIPVNLPW